MARKQLEAYQLTKAERREQRRQKAPVTPVHDRRATDAPKGVIPAATDVPCPSGDGTRLRVIRNIRGDVLATMLDKGEISAHQFDAGRRWERHWQDAEIGGIKAMDTTKEPVDGRGQSYEPLTDKQRVAVRALRSAEARLGVRGSVLVNLVLGRGWSIRAIAEHMGSSTARERLFYGRMFRDCLDILAVEFGLADRKLLDRPSAG